MKFDNISADIPADLADADEALTRYGRWAAGRGSRNRCGSAEREYRPSGVEARERRRAPLPLQMPAAEAMACQRALARVPDQERVVLALLYVPRRQPPEQQLRLLRIPPVLSRDRHLRGLRMFWNIRKLMDAPQGTGRDVAVPAQPSGDRERAGAHNPGREVAEA